MSYKLHINCRACGFGPQGNAADFKSGSQESLVSVLDLGVMPLPNAFKKAGESRPGHYPINLLACPRCGLGQLSAVVDPLVMYADYPYVTSPSQTMKDHFRFLWDMLSKHRKIQSVIEIGSNDGLMLATFRDFGATELTGIDPASNLARISRDRGINTITALFDVESARYAAIANPSADLIIARHVFCHIDDWHEFIRNIETLCCQETIVCIEVPYAGDMIRNCEWDTVYAEHLSYLTIQSVMHLLMGSKLRLHHIEKLNIHGGAVALILRRKDSVELPDVSVMKFLEVEKCKVEDWKEFGVKAKEKIWELRDTIHELVIAKKRVVGYGASAKATQWINACGFTKKELEAVYDYTPQKWYTTVPGTDIPVKNEGAFYADSADYAVSFCWNYQSEVMKRQHKWIEEGGRFIVPVPEVKIL